MSSIEARISRSRESSGRWPLTFSVSVVPLGCLLSCLVYVTVMAARPLNNFDTWFHLRLGDEFWGNWSIAHPGSLSRFATAHWVPTQWSTEMLAAKFEDWFGVSGVAWLFGVLYLIFVVAVYVVCRRQGSALAATVATLMAVGGAATVLTARPQIVSMILLAVTLAAWLQTYRDARARWWLIPTTWVWATAHGLWSVGVVTGAVTCAGLLLDRKTNAREAGRLLLVPALSVAAAMCTPVGPRLVASQFAVADRTPLIGEWGPTSFRGVSPLLVAAMIAWLVVLWARRGQVGWTPLLLLLFATGATIYYARLAPVGGVIVAPLLTEALQGCLPSSSNARARRGEWLALAAGTILCAAALGVAVPRTANHPAGVPARFATRLEALPPGSAVLNPDFLGGWLEWRFPQVNPTIDGMFDAYPVSYIRASISAAYLEPGWRNFVDRIGAHAAVLQAHTRLANALQVDLGWRRVQTDNGWVYLVAPGN